MGNPSVLIVEDNQLLSNAWSVLLQKASFNVVANTASDMRAKEVAQQYKPSIILLDLNLGKISGLELLPVLLAISPSSRIIIVTISAFPQLAHKAIKAGAKGYLTKNEDFGNMLNAIDIVFHGGTYLSARMENFEKEEIKSSGEATFELLSKTEKDIVQYLVEGKSTHEIAMIMDRAKATIETHRHHILKKLNCKNTPELIDWILKNSDLK